MVFNSAESVSPSIEGTLIFKGKLPAFKWFSSISVMYFQLQITINYFVVI